MEETVHLEGGDQQLDQRTQSVGFSTASSDFSISKLLMLVLQLIALRRVFFYHPVNLHQL